MATSSGNQKSERLNLRVSKRDRDLFEQGAGVESRTLTEFLVEGGRERAERLLADRSDFVLGESSYRQLMVMLDRPARLKPELVDLFRRPDPR